MATMPDREARPPMVVDASVREREAADGVANLGYLARLLTAVLVVNGPLTLPYEAIGSAAINGAVKVTQTSEGVTIELNEPRAEGT